jgi:2-hydroxymuconate-semialdehyde hydrolase
MGSARRAAIPGGELAYLDEGKGPAVVLLHGTLTSSRLWREFVPLLAGRFRVIAPDLLGHGASTPTAEARLDIAGHARAVHELLVEIGVDRFAVVGHGSGGGVAQLLALDGDGVDAMVLLDTVAFDGWPAPPIRTMQDRIVALDGLPDQDVIEAFVRATFDLGMRQHARFPDAALDEYIEQWRGPGGALRFARSIEGADGDGLAGREGDLGGIEFPVLILWGEDDPFLPSSLGERLNDAMPSSTLGLLPGCGHFLPEEAPETIAPMIAEYLRARFLNEPHGHAGSEGIVMLQLERRPPWVDLEADEADDWYVEDGEGAHPDGAGGGSDTR